jgi:hypothetical protein
MLVTAFGVLPTVVQHNVVVAKIPQTEAKHFS